MGLWRNVFHKQALTEGHMSGTAWHDCVAVSSFVCFREICGQKFVFVVLVVKSNPHNPNNSRLIQYCCFGA